MKTDQFSDENGGYLTIDAIFGENIDHFNLQTKSIKLFALARHSLIAILNVRSPKAIWMPKFTCQSLQKTAIAYGTKVKLYSINEHFLPELTYVDDSELVVVNNYFGLLKSSQLFSGWLSLWRPGQIVIDNTHSLSVCSEFPNYMNFISPRKFLPVTDGGMLFDDKNEILDRHMPDNKDISWPRISWLYRLIDEGGRHESYQEYKNYRENLQNLEYLRISSLTHYLLRHYDIKKIISNRNAVFNSLLNHIPIHRYFSNFTTDNLSSPIGFPIYVDDPRMIQRLLAKNRIYCAQFWPELYSNTSLNDFESKILGTLLFIPLNAPLNAFQLAAIKSQVKY